MRLHYIKGSRLQLDWLFSSSHWMWHCFIYFRQSEDIILGYMEMTARSNSNICKTKQRYSTCRNNRSNPAEWGWRRFDEYYISFQSNLPYVTKSCRELYDTSFYCKVFLSKWFVEKYLRNSSFLVKLQAYSQYPATLLKMNSFRGIFQRFTNILEAAFKELFEMAWTTPFSVMFLLIR